MYVLKPIIHETIWGGRKLSKYVGDVNAKIGHLYLISGHENLTNEILYGESAGKTLGKLFDENKLEWNMKEYDEFPLTIALVDASDDLSIQVHPNDEKALKLEKEKIGKLESWIFIEGPESGWIYGGCECHTVDEIRQAVDGGYIDMVTSRYTVNEGDCVTVEAGTLHSMTRGSLVYEVEYGSNYTYRFYDFNRKDSSGNMRELHIDKAIESIDPLKKPKSREIKDGKWDTNECYEICCIVLDGKYINNSGKIECVAIVDGELVCDYGKSIESGYGIILLPGEEIKGVSNNTKIIVARLSK